MIHEVIFLAHSRVSVRWLVLGWLTVYKQVNSVYDQLHQSQLYGVVKSSISSSSWSYGEAH